MAVGRLAALTAQYDMHVNNQTIVSLLGYVLTSPFTVLIHCPNSTLCSSFRLCKFLCFSCLLHQHNGIFKWLAFRCVCKCTTLNAETIEIQSDNDQTVLAVIQSMKLKKAPHFFVAPLFISCSSICVGFFLFATSFLRTNILPFGCLLAECPCSVA